MVAFSALRAFALTERNIAITILVAALSMVPFAANLVRRPGWRTKGER